MWFRQFYRLPPTDERFLNATPSLIREEYYLYVLRERLAVAHKEEVTVRTLNDLLGPLTFDEKKDVVEKEQAEEALAEKTAEPEVLTFSMGLNHG